MTRPRAASERFCAQLPGEVRDQLNVIVSPLIEIVPQADALELDGLHGLIFTSTNAVSIAAGLTPQRNLPCYCIGDATTAAAQGAGWQAEKAGANASELVATLSRTQPASPLLHLRGTHSRGDIAARLTGSGCKVREQIVYDQRLVRFSDTAISALAGAGPVIAPVFSPRTARHFAKLHAGGNQLYLAALSGAVAKPLKALKYNALLVAERPDSATMAALVRQLVNRVIRVEGNQRAQ